MVRHLYLCALLAVLASCSLVENSKPDVKISGRVVDYHSEEPLAGIVLRVFEYSAWSPFTSRYKPVLSVVSENDGTFEFSVKSGRAIDIHSIVSDTQKIGDVYTLEKVSDDKENIVLKHRPESIALIERPPRILSKDGERLDDE